ncbi:unnamed protein product [Adineta ricciae]|uniref:Uncharacterized protein n=1 Tax=Adineta ricciae TaxID=249248 RepID=A0A815KG95_ADIRI|nr:unnamed protein product [Adineta ricciae]
MKGNNDFRTTHWNPSTDQLSPLFIKRLNFGDTIGVNQQLLSTNTNTLLNVKTDPDEISSLESLLSGVVKIFCTSIPCNFYLPWEDTQIYVS